jgi:hypothetical protein
MAVVTCCEAFALSSLQSSPIALADILVVDLFAMTGCVYPYPPGGEVFAGPPPVVGPSLNIGIYGTPRATTTKTIPFLFTATDPSITMQGGAITSTRAAITCAAATDTTIDSQTHRKL